MAAKDARRTRRRVRKRIQQLIRKFRQEVPVAMEVLRVSGVRALAFRYRRAVRVRMSGRTIQIPVAIADVLAADWTDPTKEAPHPPQQGSAPLTVNWVLPPIVLGSGGHTTIFRFVRHLESRGHACRLYFYNPLGRTSFREQVDTVRRGYKPMQAEILPFKREMEPCDAVVATMWPTAYAVFNSNAFAKKFYFVQDFEPDFYPAGTESALAENTYRFGFHGITAGQWLSSKLARDFGMVCDHFDFGSDSTEYINERQAGRAGVVFYARPGTPRRGFGLGVMALELFHQRHPEHEIHMIGRGLLDFEFSFPFVNHGVLSHEELNRLYNRCAAGLVISFTNMSLLPLELLVAGCIPVVNEAPNTRMVGGSRYIEYAVPSPQALASALSGVVERPDLRSYAFEASESVRHLSWEDAGDKVEGVFLRELRLNAA